MPGAGCRVRLVYESGSHRVIRCPRRGHREGSEAGQGQRTAGRPCEQGGLRPFRPRRHSPELRGVRPPSQQAAAMVTAAPPLPQISWTHTPQRCLVTPSASQVGWAVFFNLKIEEKF